MKRGTPDHPKTLMLAHELSIPKYAAVGLLESLWHWTAQYAPGGDVGRFADHFIGAAVGWERDASELVTALVKARWLDEHPEHRLVVHHWRDHADDGVHMKLARAGERFADGQPPKLTKLGKAERETAERALVASDPKHNPCSTDRAAQPVPHVTYALPSHALAKPSLSQAPPSPEAAGQARTAGEGGEEVQSGGVGGEDKPASAPNGNMAGVVNRVMRSVSPRDQPGRIGRVQAALDRVGIESKDLRIQIVNRRDLSADLVEAVCKRATSRGDDPGAYAATMLKTKTAAELRAFAEAAP